jgi:hypothetical protein
MSMVECETPHMHGLRQMELRWTTLHGLNHMSVVTWTKPLQCSRITKMQYKFFSKAHILTMMSNGSIDLLT